MSDADFENDAMQPDAVDRDEQLGLLSKLCQMLNDAENKLEKLQEEQQKLNDLISGLSGGQIPELMNTLMIKKIQTTNGFEVKVEPFYSAKIPDERAEEAFKWLADNDSDAIIKAQVAMSFGKGEEEKKQEAAAIKALEELHVPFSHKRGVHPMTLKSFVRERIESGKTLPTDLFGVYVGQKAKIKAVR